MSRDAENRFLNLVHCALDSVRLQYVVSVMRSAMVHDWAPFLEILYHEPIIGCVIGLRGDYECSMSKLSVCKRSSKLQRRSTPQRPSCDAQALTESQ